MKMLLTTAVISAALAFPALAESTIGSDDIGEANGSFRASVQQEPEQLLVPLSSGQRAMAQAPRQTTKSDRNKSEKAPDASSELLKSPTGMDGGNRK